MSPPSRYLNYPNGRAVTYDYGTSGSITDQASQIASLIDSDGSATHLADESYLGLGTVVQQDSTEADLQYTLIKASGTDPVTGDIYSGLDLFGRIKELRWQTISTTADLSHVDYGYNRASSRTWRANRSTTGDYDWLYNYDGLQRVAGGTRGTLNSTETAITDPTFGQCWTLDSMGNWQEFRQDDTGSGTWNLEQARTESTVNEITAINNTTGPSWATPVYDPAGNMTTIPRPGLTTLVPQFGAIYDAWNRLVKLTDDGTGLTTQQYQYDGRNYRTVVQTYDTGTLSQIRHAYYTDNWQCVEERLGTSPDSANPDRQFVWGVRYIDDLICRNHSDSGVLDVRLYACQDANWNMTAVVDTSGAVQERYEYDPYGNPTFLSPTFTVRTSSSYAWETLYAGYRFDTGTGLYSVRNRYYHPRLGVWLTRDPLGFNGGGHNLYEYVGGNCISAIDATGLGATEDAVNAAWSIRCIRKAGEIGKKNPWQLLNPASSAFIPYQIGYAVYSLVDAVPAAIREGSKEARQKMIEAAQSANDPVTAPIMYGIGMPLSVGGELLMQGTNTFTVSVLAGGPLSMTAPGKAFLSSPGLQSATGVAATGYAGTMLATHIAMNDATPSDVFYLALPAATTYNINFPSGPTTTATAWGPPGVTPTLGGGSGWVQLGGPTRTNQFLTGTTMPTFPPRPPYPFEPNATGAVPTSSLCFPKGSEGWKGFLGQRVYSPDP